MLTKSKSLLRILIGMALIGQLTGCYVDVDHHYHPWWHHRDAVEIHAHD